MAVGGTSSSAAHRRRCPPGTASSCATTAAKRRGYLLATGGDPIVRDHRESKIKHVFVLMLENRSFDHMLGFSGITGTDAATGQPTSIDGLNGSESNSYNGVTYSGAARCSGPGAA